MDINIRWKGEPFSLTARGHVGAARNKNNHDLVCCAVSTIVQTLGVSCASLMEVETVYHRSDGFAEILVTGTETHWDQLVPRFQMAIEGLTVLANQYPQNVSLTVSE
jgi:uncharacterized protein YsxB (DUF464 family)